MLSKYCFGAIIVCVLLDVSLAQEKFTLLNNKDNGTVREIRVGRAPQSTTEKQVFSTKVPYKKLECPPEPIRIPIFSLPCNNEKDCRVFGPNLACCKERCIKGVLRPVETKITKPPPTKRTPRVLSNEIAISSNELLANSPAKQIATTNRPKTTVQPPISSTPTSKTPPKLELICPNNNTRLPFFSIPCRERNDCRLFGRNLLCCRNACVQGVLPPKEEVNHAPALFGLVDRHCPVQPLAEVFDVKECDSDVDCVPRICCPEQNSLTRKSYCRTPVHNIERLPGAKRIQEPLRNFVSYMQCTPPPPRELFPKPCNNTLDCFPNLCCQENGKKFCRPPRRSLVALVADVTTRVGASEATRRFIERITS